MSVVSTAEALPGTARVWVYQAHEPFPETSVPKVRRQIQSFVSGWVSHNRSLRAFGDLYHDRFVVLMVDEGEAGASGCSIDSSVRFLKGLGQQFGRDLFDRMRFSYRDGDAVHTVDRDTFAARYQNKTITGQTPVFDTLVQTKEAFDREFVKPLKDSWHARLV